MPDRATYLARVFLTRLRQLDDVSGDESGMDEQAESARRQELVSKVLAVEAGIVDGTTVRRVAQALPRVDRHRALSDRDKEELAAFLRAQLKLS